MVTLLVHICSCEHRALWWGADGMTLPSSCTVSSTGKESRPEPSPHSGRHACPARLFLPGLPGERGAQGGTHCLPEREGTRMSAWLGCSCHTDPIAIGRPHQNPCRWCVDATSPTGGHSKADVTTRGGKTGYTGISRLQITLMFTWCLCHSYLVIPHLHYPQWRPDTGRYLNVN